METNIWACEETFLINYLEKIENATAEEVKLANDLFIDGSQLEILSINGIEATISINGVLSQTGPPPIARFFGFKGTGFDQILQAIEEISANDDIQIVRLKMDTPGGQAIGTDEVFQELRSLGEHKKLIAENNGMMASGGFWLAVAAEEIISTSPMNITGSIGVKIAGFDISEALKREGIKKVVIVSENAPNKAMSIDNKKGIDLLQQLVNAMERVFISRVASGRGVSEKIVKTKFGQGGVLIAQDPGANKPSAVSVGMIDEVLGSKSTIKLNNKTKIKTKSISLKEVKMDFTQLCADNPGLHAHVELLKKEAYDKGHGAGVEATNKEVGIRAAAAKPILESDDYPAPMKELALKVVDGSEDRSALTAAVTSYDSNVALAQEKAAVEETKVLKNTPAAEPKSSTDGNIVDATSHSDAVAKAKKYQGMGTN